jgi:hypothetical protein
VKFFHRLAVDGQRINGFVANAPEFGELRGVLFGALEKESGGSEAIYFL